MKLTPAVVALAALWGCASINPRAPAGAGSRQVVSSQPGSPGTPPVAPSAETLPDSLKTDAWAYYGLANSKPVDMVIAVQGNSATYTGSQTTTLTGVKDGKAQYSVSRTGGLADQLGSSEELSLEPEGVYTTKSDIATINKELQLPSHLKPGNSWHEALHAQTRGKEMSLDMSNKVVGVQHIDTKAGPYDALLVTTSGGGSIGDQKVRISTKTWYVKGIGVAKMEMVTTAGSAPAKTITLQLAK